MRFFFVVANHGGRYLYVDDDNQIQADHNYDLSRPPSDLASKGTVFDTGKQHQLVTNKGPVKYNMGGTPIDLQLEQINADEVCICNPLHHVAIMLIYAHSTSFARVVANIICFLVSNQSVWRIK